MPGDGSERSLRETLATGWRELAWYVAAGVVYVAIGVSFPDFLLSWVTAATYLVLCVVLIPRFLRWLRG